jgi:hypothetical protein
VSVHLRDRKKQEAKTKLQNWEIHVLYIFTVAFLQQIPTANGKALNKLPSTFFATNGVNPLNAKLNPTCPLLALVGAHHILHVSR